MNIKVVKRNGKSENYESEKIIRVVKAAGLNDEEANKLESKVKQTLVNKGKEQYTSVQIRDVVIVEIQKINIEVAKKFIWYEKLRDKSN